MAASDYITDYRIRGMFNRNTPRSISYQFQQPEPVAQHFISDYNDPLAVNSLADVILTTFEPKMKRVDLGGIEKIPLLNILTSTLADIIWDKNLRPIFQSPTLGEGLQASGLNLLTNLFETLDIAVNPVRAVVQGENILDSLGMGGRGRFNFDYDIKTGAGGFLDGVSNFAAEFVSDPFNWITFGAKGAMSTGLKKAFAGSIDDVLEEAGTKILRSAVNDDAAEAVFKEARRIWAAPKKGASILGVTFDTAQRGDSFGTIVKRVVNNFEQQSGTRLLKKIDINAFNYATKQAIDLVAQAVDNRIANSTLKGLRGVMIASENVQKGLFASVMRTSPIGWSGVGLKALVSGNLPAERFLKRASAEVKKQAKTASLIDMTRYQEAMRAFAEADTEGFKAAGFDTVDEFMDSAMRAGNEELLVSEVAPISDAIQASSDVSPAAFHGDIQQMLQTKGINMGIIEYIDTLLSSPDSAVQQAGLDLLDTYRHGYGKAVLNHVDSIKQLGRSFLEPRDVLTRTNQSHQIRQILSGYVNNADYGPIALKHLEALRSALVPAAFQPRVVYEELTAFATELAERARTLTSTRVKMKSVSATPRLALPDLLALQERYGKEVTIFRDVYSSPKKRALPDEIKGLRDEINALVEAGLDLAEDGALDVYIPRRNNPAYSWNPRQVITGHLDDLNSALMTDQWQDSLSGLIKSIEQFDPDLDLITQLQVYQVATSGADIQQVVLTLLDSIQYKLQVGLKEQVRMSYDALENFSKNMTNETGLRDAILQLSTDDTLRSELVHIADAVVQYRALERSIAQAPLSDTLKQTLWDILHTYGEMYLTSLEYPGVRETFFQKFERTMSEQIYGYKMKESSSLEAVITRHAAELELPANWRDLFHLANADVEYTNLVRRDILKKDFGDAMVLTFDIETTDLLPSGHMTELGYKLGDGPAKTLYIDTSRVPEPAALAKMFNAPGATYDELTEMYLEYRKGKPVVSLQEALEAFASDIQAAAGSRAVKVVTFNGEDFDLPAIWSRIRGMNRTNQDAYTYLDTLFLKNSDGGFVNSYDVLVEYKKSLGLEPLAAKDRTIVRNILNQYIDGRLSLQREYPLIRGKLLFKPDRHTVRSIYHGTSEILAKEIMSAGDFEAVQLLRDTAEELSAAFNQIAIANKALDSSMYGWISKDLFPLLGEAGPVMNVAQFVEKEFMGLNPRKQYDPGLVRAYFDIETELKKGYPAEALQSLFLKAEMLEAIVARIIHPDMLTDQVVGQLSKLLTSWMPLIQQLDSNYALLRLNTPEKLYAAARRMYLDLSHNKLIDRNSLEFWGAAPDAMRLVSNPRFLSSYDSGRLLPFPSPNLSTALQELGELKKLKTRAVLTQRAINQFNDSHAFFKSGDKTGFVMHQEIAPVLYEISDELSKLSYTPKAKVELWSATNAIHLKLLEHTIELTPEQLAREIWAGSAGIRILDFNRNILPPDLLARYDAWITQLPQLEKVGLSSAYIDGRVILGINPDAIDLFKGTPTSMTFGSDFDLKFTLPQIPRLQKLMDKISDGRSRFSTGTVMGIEKAKQLYETIPNSVRKQFMSPEDLMPYGLFKFTSFDRSLIGDTLSRQYLYLYTHRDILRDWASSTEFLMDHADSLLKMKVTFFGEHSEYAVRNMFKGVPDAEILDALQASSDYVLSAMLSDKASKTGWRVVTLPINAKTIAQEGVIVTTRAFAQDMMKVWNHFEFSNNFVRAFNQLIVSPLKSGYLMTLGWVARNWLSGSLNNILSMDTLSEAPRLARAQATAWRMYAKYGEWLKEAIALSDDALFDVTNATGVARLFEKLTVEEQAIYKLIDRFVNSSASGGQMEVIIKAMAGTAEHKDWIDRAGDTIQKWLWEKNPITNFLIRKPNNHIEQINRISKYLFELDMGATTDEALSRVIRSQFNYDKTSYAKLIAEMVIPFSGFMFNNLTFWLEQTAKHGWVAGLTTEIMSAIANLDEYSNYELNDNRSLQYNILAGNTVFENQMTAKLSLGVMDALTLAMNPLGTLEGRLVAPLRIVERSVVDMIKGEPWTPEKIQYEIATNLPVVGAIAQRYWPAQDGTQYVGSALKAYQRTQDISTLIFPSMLGGVKRLYYFTYNRGDTVYTTVNQDTYLKHLDNGAIALMNQQQLENIRAEAEGRSPRSMYKTKIRYRKKYTPRPRKARRVFAKRSYPPYYKHTLSAYYKVMNTVRNTQSRAVERPAKMIGPRLYKDIYTGTGKSRFQSRLMPVTTRNLKYKIRQNWAFLR